MIVILSFKDFIIFHNSLLASTSNPKVGSSKNNIFGLLTNAKAIDNFLCQPPESLEACFLATLPNPNDSNKVSLGAYVVKGAENPDHILLATGSEVSLALEAAKLIEAEGLSVKVVSMPSEFLFEEQSEEYRETLLSCRCKTIHSEAPSEDNNNFLV